LTETLTTGVAFATMAAAATSHDPRGATLPIELVRSATAFAIRRGWDVNGILHEAGIPPLLLAEGRARVTEEQGTRIVRALWRLTDDEAFGIGTHPLPRGSFRLLLYGLTGAPDLGAALERAQGFAAAIPALPKLEVSVDEDLARVAWDRFGVADDPDHLLAYTSLAVVHRIMAWGVARPVPLHHVELPFAAPASTEMPDLVFGAPQVYGAACPAITFDAALLRAPLMRDERELDEFIARSPAGLLARVEAGAATTDRVRRLVEQGLRDSSHLDGDEIARRLAISPQTLRRKLAAEGTSLREIRETVLRDAAVTSLVDGRESLAEISQRLGFSEPSAFTRAFRRWTGSPPSAYRAGSDD
jgi:AraC-like DNA-binding protein